MRDSRIYASRKGPCHGRQSLQDQGAGRCASATLRKREATGATGAALLPNVAQAFKDGTDRTHLALTCGQRWLVNALSL